MKTLHALIVGINQYADGKISNLEAAVHDSKRVEKYFTENAAGNYIPNIKSIHDGAATRAGILAAFEDHLINSGATSNDVLLFYYSGHGGQEMADPIFHKYAPDKKLENFACHDASLAGGTGFIADKEIRWLIHQATQSGAHFLNISDSCHSGGNTRGVGVDEMPKATARLSGLAERPRKFDEFIFNKKIDLNQLKINSLDDVIPQGNHISISACQSHESAFEIFNGGIFTTGLLDFLKKSKGDISYFDLKTRIKNYVTGKFKQSPQIYSSHDNPKALFQTFLGGAMKEKPAFANASYNHNIRKWEIDMGAIYGITEKWKGAKQQVIITNHQNKQLTAFITKVFPAHAEIAFVPYSDIQKSEQYQAFVPSMMTREMSIQLIGDDDGIKVLKESISEEARKKESIKFTTEKENTDYTIRAIDGEYHITLPENEHPLTGQEIGYDTASAQNLMDKLSKIGKWHFAKNLQNEFTNLKEESIKIEVFENQNLLSDNGLIYTLDVNPETLKTPIKISLTNQSEQSLYCGMIYLSSLFGMSPKLIQGQVQKIPSGASLWARDGNFINLKLEDYIQELNWEAETFYVQVVVSNKEFGLELFLQKELDAPRGSSKGITRGMEEDDWLDEATPDWRTFLLEFRLRNPENS